MVQMYSAVGIQKYGGPEQLQPLTLPLPPLAAHAVRVQVVAAGVNPGDALMRRGALWPLIRHTMPFVPGMDIAGIVSEVGAAVTRFKTGDAVYGMLPNTAMGGYAQSAVIAEKAIAPIPHGLTFAQAAALPCAALTALQALRDKAHLQHGQRLLINGAAGGVGSLAVQIARQIGAQVTGTCSPHNFDFVRGLGADEVWDYNAPPTAQSYDVIFDAAGVKGFGAWQPLLRSGGVIVTVNPGLGNPLAVLLARFNREGKRLASVLVTPAGSDLRLLNNWLEAKTVTPVIQQVYPLVDAPAAHQALESKHVRGKLVLAVEADRASQIAR